jgi:hypothetical protein
MKCLWNMPMLALRYALHGQLSLEKDIKNGQRHILMQDCNQGNKTCLWRWGDITSF